MPVVLLHLIACVRSSRGLDDGSETDGLAVRVASEKRTSHKKEIFIYYCQTPRQQANGPRPFQPGRHISQPPLPSHWHVHWPSVEAHWSCLRWLLALYRQQNFPLSLQRSNARRTQSFHLRGRSWMQQKRRLNIQACVSARRRLVSTRISFGWNWKGLFEHLGVNLRFVTLIKNKQSHKRLTLFQGLVPVYTHTHPYTYIMYKP